MIVGGFNDLGKVEIIDPLDNSANFPMTINYPKSHEFEVFSDILAVTIKEDFILLCNSRGEKQCFTFDNKELKQVGILGFYERQFASAVTINDSFVWITGGLDEYGPLDNDKTEVLQIKDDLFKVEEGPDLHPLSLSHHCSIAINESTVLLIGGKIGYDTLNLIWAYDFVTDRWTWDLPRMNKSREDHSCATYLNENGELEVMVIGGYSTETLDVRNSSEVLLPSKMQGWELGPELPKALTKHSSVVFQNSIYVIGGWSDRWSNSPSQQIFRLEIGKAEWIKLEQSLKNYKMGFKALIVPSHLLLDLF